METTFADLHPVMLPDGPTGAFTVDIPRIDAVMTACARALHFHRTGNKHSDWQIMLPSLHFRGHVDAESHERWRTLLAMVEQIPFTAQATSVPDVFQYALGDIPGCFYLFCFYGDFMVLAGMRNHASVNAS